MRHPRKLDKVCRILMDRHNGAGRTILFHDTVHDAIEKQLTLEPRSLDRHTAESFSYLIDRDLIHCRRCGGVKHIDEIVECSGCGWQRCRSCHKEHVLDPQGEQACRDRYPELLPPTPTVPVSTGIVPLTMTLLEKRRILINKANDQWDHDTVVRQITRRWNVRGDLFAFVDLRESDADAIKRLFCDFTSDEINTIWGTL